MCHRRENSMKLRKDDPIYYKLKINTLIKEAFENGLQIQTVSNEDILELIFKSDNGDTAISRISFKK